jgi:hypothetical protein
VLVRLFRAQWIQFYVYLDWTEVRNLKIMSHKGWLGERQLRKREEGGNLKQFLSL